MAKGKAPTIKFVDSDAEPEWMRNGRQFAEELAARKIGMAERSIQRFLNRKENDNG